MNKTILGLILLALLTSCSTSNLKNDRAVASSSKKWNEKGSSKKIKIPVRPFEIEIVDSEGVIIDKNTPDVRFYASLVISQPSALVNFDFFMAGNLPLPRKNYKNKNVFIDLMSSSPSQGSLSMNENYLVTREDKDHFKMKFEMRRKAVCSNKSDSRLKKMLNIGKQVSLDYNLNTRINDKKVSCQDLFRFEGTRKALEKKLNSLPSTIVCKLDMTISEFNETFLTQLNKVKDASEECIGG